MPPTKSNQQYGDKWRNYQTVPVDDYLPIPYGLGTLGSTFSAGFLEFRRSGNDYVGCSESDAVRFRTTLTRLTFTTADGTETELHDTLTGGQPHTYSGEGGSNGWC